VKHLAKFDRLTQKHLDLVFFLPWNRWIWIQNYRSGSGSTEAWCFEAALALYRNQAVSFVSMIDREGRSLVKCGSFQVRIPDLYQTTLIFAFTRVS
jgi:hypothetical protein